MLECRDDEGGWGASKLSISESELGWVWDIVGTTDWCSGFGGKIEGWELEGIKSGADSFIALGGGTTSMSGHVS